MNSPTVFEQVASAGIVPVIAIDQEAAALPLADALIEGGLPVVEITFRTAAAAAVIRTISRERPRLLVGAGTVLTKENLEAAKESGARFAVAPGLNPQIVQLAQKLNLPFVPGVATPTDIEQGLALGCRVLKFFPAEALGGIPMIEALSAPYQHTGARFIPTGGVSTSNLEAYLRIKTVAAVGGTWIAKKEDLSGGKWSDIAARCRAAVEVVRRARGVA
jgi:2-dehydro-3-deoxyphosphogluconate aldolase/(4S)-4-hydroxy-2-oxoglutarate aldolase